MKEEKSAPVSESELFRRRHAIHIICPVFPIHIGAKCPVFLFKFGAFPCFSVETTIYLYKKHGLWSCGFQSLDMYREIEKKIQDWIDGSRKALLVYGARQVGKTYIIRKMLEQNDIRYCEYNLIEREDIVSVLEAVDDAGDISTRLAMYSDKPLTEKESVIFLDEIQRYPDIITKIKFLVDEGKYRYIISGSNLGVELRKLIQAFYYYLIVGGMPEAVNVYNATHSLNKIQEEQQSIVRQYKLDFTAYEREERKLKINAIYDNIPASPLAMAKETNVFKLFLSDVGLLTSCYPQFIKQELLEMNPDREINNGALFENFVAQEIYSVMESLYYFKKKAIGEVDFIIERQDKAIPIEVKSGSDYKKHAALNHLLEHYPFEQAYVLSLNNVEKKGNIKYLPIYMLREICKEDSARQEHDIIPGLM